MSQINYDGGPDRPEGCTCDTEYHDSHTCPYGQEIEGSCEECHCCPVCEERCAQDLRGAMRPGYMTKVFSKEFVEPKESGLQQVRYTRDGLYLFNCYRCGANLELPLTFSWMVTIHDSTPFELPATCPVRFCWSCARPFVFGKMLDQ